LNLRVKKVLMALGGALAAVLLAGLYYGYQLTRKEDLGFGQAANTPDSNEASRKIKLLMDAQSSGKRGFVRFSEVEVNSFLQTHFNVQPATNLGPQTVQSFADLNKHDLVWFSVIRRPILGKPLDFLWERTISLQRETNGYVFPVKSMRVGDLDIPQRFWPQIEEFFDGADAKYDDRLKWVAHLPWIELTNNELSLQPELRLYNYNPRQPAKP
jgi:hypothetical protein